MMLESWCLWAVLWILIKHEKTYDFVILFDTQCPDHKETSHLTGIYMVRTINMIRKLDVSGLLCKGIWLHFH